MRVVGTHRWRRLSELAGLGDWPAEALPLARTELVLGALRVVAAVLAVLTAFAAPLGTHRGRVLAAAVAVLVAAVAMLVLVALTRSADGLRRLAIAVTAADVVVFGALTAAFHDVPGAGPALGILAFIEGPVRWGLRGGVASAAVTGVAVLWPQRDNSGMVPAVNQTIVVSLLLFGITVLVSGFLSRTAAQVRQAHEQFRRVFESSSTGMALMSTDGKLLETNRAFSSAFGARPAPPASLTELALPADQRAIEEALRAAAEGGRGRRLEARFVRGEGQPFEAAVDITRIPGGRGVRPMLAVQIDDISEQKAFEARLSHQASHDGLTGLPNRAYLRRRLEEALEPRQGWAPCAVLFCDLDRFKRINDSLGHDFGDALLVETAHRLAKITRPGDVVARLGGDEFVLLLNAVWSEADVLPLAERVLEVLRAPVQLGELELRSGGSVGIALARPGDTPEVLLRDADTAMYRAKEAGGGQALVFSPSMRTELLAQQELERDLRLALSASGASPEGLGLAFQVGVDVGSGRIALVEALLRWANPSWAHCTPLEIVRVAEECGLAGELGSWVVGAAVAEASRWPGFTGLITVNASSRQVVDPGFAGAVRDALEQHGFPASRLCIEVTEDSLTDDTDPVARALRGLRELGVRIAIDDFGTGHASLSRLAAMPVDILKIDRAFTRGIVAERGPRAIVEGIVGMARAFDLMVVAEGVETAEQLAALKRVGADVAQGYLLGAPTSGDAISARLMPPAVVAPRQPEDRATLAR